VVFALPGRTPLTHVLRLTPAVRGVSGSVRGAAGGECGVQLKVTT